MNPLNRLLLTFSLLAAVTVWSQAPPPPNPDAAPGAAPAPQPQPRKITYLGVYTVPTTETVRRQLGLQDGIGLTITHVAPNSPAARAGLRKHDVIKKLNDQWIVNQPQLSVLIRTFKPGDKVKLTVIRAGKPQIVEAELGETTQTVFNTAPFQGNPMIFQWRRPENAENFPRIVPPNLGPASAEAVRKAIEKFKRQMEQTDVPQRLQDAAKELEKALGRIGPNRQGVQIEIQPGADGIMTQKMHSVYSDGQHSLQVTKDENGKHLKVTDKNGNVVFEGPINNENELKAVPAEIREKLNRMGKNFLWKMKVQPHGREPMPETGIRF